MESIDYRSEQFKYPILEKERGEFERVSDYFKINLSDLLYAAEDAKMVTLDEEMWRRLDNSESYHVRKGDWGMVERISAAQEVPRDWKTLKNDIEKGMAVNAPIILKVGDVYHLVSGNTRLMVCKALGVIPKVLVVEVG